MINGKRIAVVMPAYNAERTLEKTVRGLPGVVDIKAQREILIRCVDNHRQFRGSQGGDRKTAPVHENHEKSGDEVLLGNRASTVIHRTSQ